jgi:hypothetical protein
MLLFITSSCPITGLSGHRLAGSAVDLRTLLGCTMPFRDGLMCVFDIDYLYHVA